MKSDNGDDDIHNYDTTTKNDDGIDGKVVLYASAEEIVRKPKDNNLLTNDIFNEPRLSVGIGCDLFDVDIHEERPCIRIGITLKKKSHQLKTEQMNFPGSEENIDDDVDELIPSPAWLSYYNGRMNQNTKK